MPLLRHAAYLDTLSLSKEVHGSAVGAPGQPQSLALGALYRHYTLEPPSVAHRALADCVSNAAVLRGLLNVPGALTVMHGGKVDICLRS